MAGWQHWRLRPYAATGRQVRVEQLCFWGVSTIRATIAKRRYKRKERSAARQAARKLRKEET